MAGKRGRLGIELMQDAQEGFVNQVRRFGRAGIDKTTLGVQLDVPVEVGENATDDDGQQGGSRRSESDKRLGRQRTKSSNAGSTRFSGQFEGSTRVPASSTAPVNHSTGARLRSDRELNSQTAG